MWTQTVALAAMLTACASHPHGMMPRELRGESLDCEFQPVR